MVICPPDHLSHTFLLAARRGPEKDPMRKNRKPSVLVLVTALIFSFSIQLQGQQSAKGKSAENSTTALLHMHSAYQQASAAQKPQLLTQFTAIAAQRQQLLSSLIQTNPGDVLRVAIPNDVSQKMPSTVRGYVEQSVTAQGALEAVVEMQGTMQHLSGANMHYGLTTAQGKLGLHFATNPPHHLLTGSVVRVQGVQVGSELALASGSNSTTNTSVQTVSAALPNTIGPISLAVLLVNFQDNPVQPFTASSVDTTFFSGTKNVSSTYLEESYGQTSLTGQVFGWLTMNTNTTCSYSTIASAAQQATQAAGINLSAFSHQAYVFPNNSTCGFSGLGTVGGNQTWYNGAPGLYTGTHELGHNLGLYHSHSMECGSAAICSSGTMSEYGDYFDSMGGFPAHFNTFQKERLGWLNYGISPPTITVTSSGTYQIGPYEAQDGIPKALKILKSATSSGSTYYYAEFRQPLGFDSFLSSSTYLNVRSGVIIHSASPSDGNSSDILDMTPSSSTSSTNDWFDPALDTGQSLSDPTAGVTITPRSVSSTGASVQVTFGGATCTNVNPTTSVSPSQSSYVLAGTPVNFTVTVKDNDGSSCAPATFNLNATVPSGWTGVWNTSALSLSPGASASATLAVSSPTGTPDGFYNIGMSAVNAAASSYADSSRATYVISTPAPVSITVATNQSTYTPGQTVAATVTVLSGTSPDAGDSVSVSVTSPSGSTKTLNGNTGNNGVASFSYRLSKRSAKGMYQVRASMPSTGVAATMGASTTFTVQ
jgi:hypothetical protein